MPLSPETIGIVAQAAGRAHWICDETKRQLEAAAHADNPASALATLRGVQADVLFLSTAISNAIYQCERDVRGDENVPAVQEFISILKRATAPKLSVVR